MIYFMMLQRITAVCLIKAITLFWVEKEEFMKSWQLFKSIGPTILSKIEEGQNGYYIELVSFQDFMTVLNFLGQMAAQFNVDYCYEEGNEYYNKNN